MSNNYHSLYINLFVQRGRLALITLLLTCLGLATVQAASSADNTSPFALRMATGPDSDGDGIRNQDDLDDENDGILDVDEGLVDADGNGVPDASSTDTDGDGTPDALDLDSDNDGILDLLESQGERELVRALDQVPNGAIDIGIDVGLNGIPNIIETAPDSGVLTYALADTDGDGVPDFRDRDSDSDGIYDVIEAGALDSDMDGRIDGFFDMDGKGVDDTIQVSALPIFDTDGDGVLDYRDTDSDNDGIPDRVEGGDNRSMPTDTDGDGAADYRESDSDGDGTPDRLESGDDPNAPIDSDGDGVPDFQDNDPSSNDGGGQGTARRPDRDADGIANQDDLDDDNDGILDVTEGGFDADGDGFLDANSRDSDGDGTPDAYDLDSDNDGILDNLEARLDFALVSSLDQKVDGAIDINVPVGSNGVADVIETSPDSGEVNYSLVDTDSDGTPDVIDIDSDGDGISDLVEAGGVDADNDGRIDNFFDADTKGVDDIVQATALPIFDTDGDGMPDFRDTDSDNDSLSDSVEAGAVPNQPLDTDNDGAADYREQDSDGDGVPDNGVVPDVPPVSDGDANIDTDGDGVNDDVDIDDDNDGIPDSIEGNVDSDNDGVFNQFDLDSDNDGLYDSQEAAVNIGMVAALDTNDDGRISEAGTGNNGYADALETDAESGVPAFNVVDSDADGILDFLDLDSDNDSIYDTGESNHIDSDSDGRLTSSVTVNEQGLAAGAGGALIDTDGDGVIDVRDLDSDNDGIVDLVEARGTDADGNGRLDNFSDANGDGADDGIQLTTTAMIDTDGDHVADFRDLDSDQDSLSDLLETQGASMDLNNDGVLDSFIDTNGDGLDDHLIGNPVMLRDTDRDGIPDQVDLDSDGDGVTDLLEAGGVDNDADGVVDSMLDSDGDGLPDIVDVDQTGGADVDNDGIDDVADVDFARGVDSDGDGMIDLLDPDSDGNGFVGPAIANDGQGEPTQLPDADSDGTPDFQQSSGDVTIRSGASGCSIAPTDQGASDPLFAVLLSMSGVFLLLRMHRKALTIHRTRAQSVEPAR